MAVGDCGPVGIADPGHLAPVYETSGQGRAVHLELKLGEAPESRLLPEIQNTEFNDGLASGWNGCGGFDGVAATGFREVSLGGGQAKTETGAEGADACACWRRDGAKEPHG